MIKTFIFVIAIFTNEGVLEMRAVPVPKCPEAAAFTEAMDKMKERGELKDWNAICIPPQANT